jgi:hypothetical protein
LTISLFLAAGAAHADIEPYVEQVFVGPLWESGIHVYSYDLKVVVTGDDAWVAAGGPVVGEPWITLAGGEFFQHPMGSGLPPDPTLFAPFPDLQWDTFYTTPLCWPNTEVHCMGPGFAVGPIDNPDNLIADWFWTPNGNFYPGDFTIARFTVIAPPDADPATSYADIDMLIASLETLPPLAFSAHIPVPEPAGFALLALASLALLRRR